PISAELPALVPVISGWPADVPYSSDDVTDSPFEDLKLLPATDNEAVSAGGLLSMAPSGRLGCYGPQAKAVTHRGCEQERESVWQTANSVCTACLRTCGYYGGTR